MMLFGLILPVDAALLRSTELWLESTGDATPAACCFVAVSHLNSTVDCCMLAAVGAAMVLIVNLAAFEFCALP